MGISHIMEPGDNLSNFWGAEEECSYLSELSTKVSPSFLFLSDADPRHAWFGCVTGIVISIIYMECLPFMPSYRAV